VSSEIAFPRHLFRLRTSAGTRLVLFALYMHAKADEVTKFLQREGPAPFVSPTLEVLRADTDYSRTQVYRALAELTMMGQVRESARVLDGKIIRGWELTPSPPPAVISFPLVLVDGKGPPEAEAVVDELHRLRLTLGLRSQRKPISAIDLSKIERPLKVHGVGWDAWDTVLRRAAEYLRHQTAREGDVRRAAAAPLFTLAGLSGPQFARYMEREDLDNNVTERTA
jgi:hypothetical protein